MKKLKDMKRIIAIILTTVMLFTVAAIDTAAKWVEIPDCTCSHSGELAVSHTEACAEKVFYNDFCNNTAEQIFRKWALLPEDGREYILLYLSEKDEAKYTQLYSMVESAWNSKTVAYDAQDPGVSVYAAEQAFPNGTTITTEELTVSEEQQAAVMQAINDISSNITVHGFCGTNITFTDEQGAEVQPSGAVSMKLTLKQSDSLSSVNTVIVLHEGENGLEVVGKVPIYGENTQSVAVAASGFSNYYSVLVSVPDKERSLAKLYNLNNGDRLGTTKATDFYAYIAVGDHYLTYTPTTEAIGDTGNYQRPIVSKESAVDCKGIKDYLWHFTVDTRDELQNDIDPDSTNTYKVENSYKIVNVGNGLPLDLYGYMAKDNNPVVFAESHDRYNQRWFINCVNDSGGNKKYTFTTTMDSNFLLNHQGGSDGSNEPKVVVRDKTTVSDNFNFDIILDPDSKNTISSLYQEKDKTYLSGSVPALTDFYAYISFNDHLLTYDETVTTEDKTPQDCKDWKLLNRLIVSNKTADECKGDKKYLWRFILDDRYRRPNEYDAYIGGSYRIVNAETGTNLDNTDFKYKNNGPVTLHASDYKNAAQRWFINYDAAYDKFYINVSHSDTVVFDAQGGGVDNTIVDLYSSKDGVIENQRFDIILADTSEYQSGLMSDKIEKDSNYSNYSIKNFDVNLFDYDPVEFNNSETEDTLAFDGYQKYLSDFENTSLTDLHNFSDEEIVDNGDEFYAYISFNGPYDADNTERCITYNTTTQDPNGENYQGLWIGSAPSKIQGVKRYLWRFVRNKTDNTYAIQNMDNNKWLDIVDSEEETWTDQGQTHKKGIFLQLVDGTTEVNNRYWQIKYTKAGGGKFQIFPASTNFSGYKLDVAGGGIFYTNYVNLYQDGTVEHSYFNITIANKVDGEVVNAGDRFYAYMAYRPENTPYWVTHKVINEQDTSIKEQTVYFDKLVIGEGENLDNNYLWEFIRDESDTYKNSYIIRNVAQNNDSYRSYVDLNSSGTFEDNYIKLHPIQSDALSISAQRWYIRYNAASNRFYITSAVDTNQNWVFGVSGGKTAAGTYVNISNKTDNPKQLFDLLLVNGQRNYSNTSEVVADYGKYLSDSSGYTEPDGQNGGDTVTPGDHFYANILFRTDDDDKNTSYLTHLGGLKANAKAADGSVSEIEYYGMTIGKGINIDRDYLWEFTRVQSGDYKNSYLIKNVASDKYVELTNGIIYDSQPIKLADKYIGTDSNSLAAQRWYIQFHNFTVGDKTYKRFYLASAINQEYAIDVNDGKRDYKNRIQIYKKDNTVDNQNKMFDLLIFNDKYSYDLPSKAIGNSGKYLSDLESYTNDQIVSFGDHFYANIAFRKDGTSYWLTNKAGMKGVTKDANGNNSGDEFEYRGIVIGNGTDYNTNTNYLWEFVRDRDGDKPDSYQINSVSYPGLCIDLNYAIAVNGQIIKLLNQHADESYSTVNAQRWYIRYHNYTAADGKTYKRFYLESACDSNFTLDVDSGNTAQDTKIQLWVKNESDVTETGNKMFDFRIVTDLSSYGLDSSYSENEGKYLSAAGKYSNKETLALDDDFYANIAFMAGNDSPAAWVKHGMLSAADSSTLTGNETQYDRLITTVSLPNDDKNYLWRFIRERSGTYKNSYRIINVATGKCVDLYDNNGNKTFGGNITLLNDYDGSASQHWYIKSMKSSEGKMRLMIASAQHQAYYFDLYSGNYTNGRIDVYTASDPPGNTNVYFDLYIVKDQTYYDTTKNIVDNNLSANSYPTITGSSATGEDLFNPEKAHAGKTTVAKNAKMEFIYDKSTGYYEYKSTANHAQYNPETNTIEQYTDTLGNYNYSSYDVPITDSNYLDVFGEPSKIENRKARIKLSMENGMVVGKMIGEDPHFAYYNLNIDADKVSKIYAKVYIDPRITSEKFSIYFKKGNGTDVDFAESGRFLVDFNTSSSTNGWYEFVIDTSGQSYTGESGIGWSGNITGLRIDPIDNPSNSISASATDPYDFKLAQLSLIYKTSEYSSSDSAGAFLPLADINKSATGQGGSFSRSSWESEFNNTSVTNTPASRAIVNDLPQSTRVVKEILPSDRVGVGNVQTTTAQNGKALTIKVGGNSFYGNTEADPQIYYGGLNIKASDVRWIVIKAKIPDTIKSNAFQLLFNRAGEANWDAGRVFTVFYDSSQRDSDGFYEFYFDTTKIGDGNYGNAWNGTIAQLRLDPVDFQSNNGFIHKCDPQTYEEATNNNANSLDITIQSIKLLGEEPSTSNEVIKSISPASAEFDSESQKYNVKSYDRNSDGSLTVTMINETSDTETGKGKDLYWDYRNINVNASDVKAIRIMAKIPQIIENNYFQVFFANTEDVNDYYNNGDYKGPYLYGGNGLTAYFNKNQVGEDGYYEFYFSINDHKNWYGTIERLRLDPVDFQPPNTFSPNSCPADLTITIKSIELIGYNSNTDERQENYDSLYFGMSMEHQFYLPTNKLDDKGKPIEFEYIGDDDLWVFIDGELALDLGGCHTAQHGKISFTDGMAYINGESIRLSEEILETNKVHTLKLFYLERSGSTSSLMIRFNLPEASVSVDNKIECANYSKLTDEQKSYYDSYKYKDAENKDTEDAKADKTLYQITATTESADKLSTLYYRIGEGAAVPVALNASGVGTFMLDKGVTAAFTLPKDYSVKVEPIDTEIKRFDYSQAKTVQTHKKPADPVTVDSITQSTAQDTLLAYAYTNTYALQKTPLTINTALTEGVTAEEGSTIIYRIQGASDDVLTKHIDLTVSAKSNNGVFDPVKINDLPVGEYKVTQDKSWAWRYKVENYTVNNLTNATRADNVVSFTLPYSDGNQLTFTNKLDYNKWLDGNSYKQNVFA